MLAEFFFPGVALGFAVAASHLGPACLLCVRHTAHAGFRAGVSAGLGSAAVHAVYAGVGALGLASIAGGPTVETALRVGSAAVLLFVGARTLTGREKPHDHDDRCSHAHAFFSVAAVELGRIGEIAIFVAAAVGLGVAVSSPVAAAIFGTGAFFGSIFWWLAVAGAVAFFREKISPKVLRGLTVVSGVAILALGVALLAGADPELHLFENHEAGHDHGAHEIDDDHDHE